MFTQYTHVLPVTTLRRARLLPSTGRVLVKQGQKVNAIDAVAECAQQSQHILLDVRKAFGLATAREADALIQRKVGEKLQEGDVIAQVGDLFARVVRAPAASMVAAIGGGQVLLETSASRLQLKAGLSGEVVEILNDRGVVIESSGTLIQGVWGNGLVEQGLLSFPPKTADEEFTRARIDVSMRGAVTFSGFCTQADALQAAAQLPLRGLILGSLAADLIPVAREMPFPVIILEGFGQLAINSVIYKLLSTNEKRDVCLNASNWDVYNGTRPEIFIPLPVSGEAPQEPPELAPGKTVRVQAQPYRSRTGKVIRIREGLTTLPSGLRVPAADVLLEGNEEVIVPLANLDVLE